jgi:hypothetical protein
MHDRQSRQRFLKRAGEIPLQGAPVGVLVGKLKATGVPQRVRVGLEPKPSRGAQARHHLAPPRRREGAPRSDVNTNGDGGSWSGLSPANRPQVHTTQWVPFFDR